MSTSDERLAELIRERDRLNEKWEEVKARLVALGEQPVFVSNEVLEQIEDAAMVRAPALPRFNGVRA